MQRLPIAIAAQQLGTSAAALYTVPTGVTATVANLSFTNTTNGVVTITVYNVPSAGSPSTANAIVAGGFSVPGGQTYVPPQVIGLNMPAGATLQASASAATSISASGGVYETSGS